MPKAKFRCKRCKRSFSMAAHLARHKNTIHGSKKSKISNARTTKKAVASRSKTGLIGAFSSTASGIIQAMQAYDGELHAERLSLDAQIDAIDRAMETLGAATLTGVAQLTGKKRGRPVEAVGRPGTLKSYIVRVLRQRSTPMGLKDISTRVKKAGFKTKSKNLYGAVSNALQGLKGVKRVGHGKYQLSGR
jgi:hypothetical protein